MVGINIDKRFIPGILKLFAQAAAVVSQVEGQPEHLLIGQATGKPDSRCQVGRIDVVGMFTKQPLAPLDECLERILARFLSLLAADIRRDGTQQLFVDMSKQQFDQRLLIDEGELVAE